MSVDAVNSYLSDGFTKINGWISPHILQLIGVFGEEMNKVGVVGGACEIGVYQGKFFIGLAHAVDLRPCLAIDVFDHQDFNIDGSGGGIDNLLQLFRKNVRAYMGVPVGEMVADSLSLGEKESAEIINKYGRFQFISIDGGHEPEHVVNDYKFCEAIIHPGGAIVIDDFMNPGWPGVLEGISSLYLLGRPKFVPFAVGNNKLFLVSKSYHQRYIDVIGGRWRAIMPNNTFWNKRLFGHEVICIL
jgi:hypothetical protein